jgi:hypothetical protein
MHIACVMCDVYVMFLAVASCYMIVIKQSSADFALRE